MKHTLRSAFNTRQYMVSKDFEVFYYSDLHFQSVPNHSHNYYEFYVFLEGNISMVIQGNEYPLHQGDILIIPPNVKHHAEVKDDSIPYRRFVFWISQEYCNQLIAESIDYVYLLQKAQINQEYVYHFSPLDYHTTQSKLLQLLEELQGNQYGKTTALYLAVNDLVLFLNRVVYQSDNKVSTGNQTLFQKLTAYIEQHLNEDLSLDSLAQQFYVNKYYIAHYFKDHLGISIHQYITKQRLAACRNAIMDGEPITKVFHEFGFSDYSSFFRAFRKEYQLSPKDVQKIYQKKQ